MDLFALLLFTSQAITAQTVMPAVEAADVSGESDILILGRKAKAVRWDFKIDKRGTLTKCAITVSSGDPQVDGLGCQATKECAAQMFEESKALFACVGSRRKVLL